MGGCTSKSATKDVAIPAEAKARRLIRQNTSEQELQRQLSDYHARPKPTLNYLSRRPSPLLIENPSGHGLDAKSLKSPPVPGRVLDAHSPSLIRTEGSAHTLNSSSSTYSSSE